jgi:BirA family transcriptional regulator, biotin operon repressor / biotin---[acetyl-CoA-carboxylase] ligase
MTPDAADRAALGRPRMHLRRTDSTNERARDLAIAGAPHGTLVSATEQTAGRGRQGRSWVAPAGSALLCSVVVRNPPLLLSLTAGVAVCDVAGEDALLKWPNDVVRADPQPVEAQTIDEHPTLAKLAGILVEGRPQDGWAVLGIGLNVAVRVEQLPPEVRARAATMGLSTDAIETTLRRLLVALDARLAEPVAGVLEAWRTRDALWDRQVAWEGGQGHARGIDERGRLLVALADGTLAALDAGEVHLAL